MGIPTPWVVSRLFISVTTDDISSAGEGSVESARSTPAEGSDGVEKAKSEGSRSPREMWQDGVVHPARDRWGVTEISTARRFLHRGIVAADYRRVNFYQIERWPTKEVMFSRFFSFSSRQIPPGGGGAARRGPAEPQVARTWDLAYHRSSFFPRSGCQFGS